VCRFEVRVDVQRGAGRPRDEVELGKEATEDDGHVERQDEGDWNQVAEVETVHRHRLKHPAHQSIRQHNLASTKNLLQNVDMNFLLIILHRIIYYAVYVTTVLHAN